MSRATALTVFALAASAAAAGAVEPSVEPFAEVRVRAELFDAARIGTDQEARYEMGLVRVRAGGDLSWGGRFALHGLVQSAAMAGVPDDAVFGSGPVYSSTNGGDGSPSQAGLLELSFTWREPSFELSVGRQAFADGAAPPVGAALPDGVRARRLADRLIGNLDFPNVGRRFDGAVFRSGLAGVGRLELFALRPLAGAFNYRDAFDRLDVDLAGGSFASPFGGWIPRSEVRLFAQGYRDDRPVARNAVGGELAIDTFGASLLAGTADWDVLAWYALQRGEWGARDHRADAWIVEAGWRFAAVPGSPSFHLGYEQASGGGPGGDHETFFNLLPTNHKFYGALDYLAFSNVRDLYLEARWSAGKHVKLSAALHDFSLVDRADAWYGGSGAMSDLEFGYAARRPAGGVFAASDLARELDFTAAWALRPNLEIKLESGRWAGSAAAEQFAPADADGAWLGLEATWRLPSRPR
ncbi:MAG TPA: alginate export family protein [Thermoanaerobaculia bacterium]